MVRAVFLHIPKTAGTSFREALCQGFGEHLVSPPFGASYISENEADSLSKYDIISGHISISDVQKYFPKAALLTVLRNPVERCLSWYHFACTLPAMPFDDVNAAQGCEPEEFFDLPINLTFRNIHNRQVRQLGGHALDREVDLDEALKVAHQTLDRCAWVGHQETLAEDIKRLGTLFPQMNHIQPKSLNVTAGRCTGMEISPSLWAKIRVHNEYDIRLLD